MPHDDGQRSGINRNLIEGIGMVAAVGLASGCHGFTRIEGARRRNDLAAGGETALLLNE
ncbi:hypothetical protein D3C86_2246550 [compost metagenome]